MVCKTGNVVNEGCFIALLEQTDFLVCNQVIMILINKTTLQE